MMRLSVSDLETYRFWCANEDATLDDLLRKLRHEEPPTPAMEAGRAFAKLMETFPDGEHSVCEVDGWKFDFSQLDAELPRPDLRELKAEVKFNTPHGPVTLVGKVDGLNGLEVRDQKLTERYDPEKYLDSLQWRAYLVMFGAKRFTYDVFSCRYKGRVVEVTGYEPFSFYAYPRIKEDVQRAVNALASIVAERGTQGGALVRLGEPAQRPHRVRPVDNDAEVERRGRAAHAADRCAQGRR